jgi:hypothetical protein
MRASQIVPQVVPFLQPVPAKNSRTSLPRTFQQALRRGWKVIREVTTLGADKRHRHGAVILESAGRSEKLKIPYTATIRQGFRFGKPQLG